MRENESFVMNDALREKGQVIMINDVERWWMGFITK